MSPSLTPLVRATGICPLSSRHGSAPRVYAPFPHPNGPLQVLRGLMASDTRDRFLYCLDRLVLRFPPLLGEPRGSGYVEHVVAMLPHVYGELRSRALDILMIAVEHVPALPKWLQQPFPELLLHQVSTSTAITYTVR